LLRKNICQNSNKGKLGYFCSNQDIVLDYNNIKDLLDNRYERYNSIGFIDDDPIQIPHRYNLKEDIEIAGFLTAIISWGKRKIIIRNAGQLMSLLDDVPYEFMMFANGKDFERFGRFVHRTFNANDCLFLVRSLSEIYRENKSLYSIFMDGYNERNSVRDALSGLRNMILSGSHEPRFRKHIPDVMNGSAAKRLNMFLRWMVRRDNNGVDFGIWTGIRPADLFIPLDVHTGNVSRKLGLLLRKQNDWSAVEELTDILREMDPADPVKYDFALFGLGIEESF
ncbi:MAG: TIGR02757 family protein, partial [Bacteroidota bacterium]